MEKANRDLEALFPSFGEKVRALLVEMNRYAAKRMPGLEWKLVEGFRTVERQQALYTLGRTAPGKRVTNLDGVRRRSAHQFGLAADVAPFVRGKPKWDVDEDHWKYLGHAARSLGLVWGGDWKRFPDRPHVEWPRSDRGTYRRARRLTTHESDLASDESRERRKEKGERRKEISLSRSKPLGAGLHA